MKIIKMFIILGFILGSLSSINAQMSTWKDVGDVLLKKADFPCLPEDLAGTITAQMTLRVLDNPSLRYRLLYTTNGGELYGVESGKRYIWVCQLAENESYKDIVESNGAHTYTLKNTWKIIGTGRDGIKLEATFRWHVTILPSGEWIVDRWLEELLCD